MTYLCQTNQEVGKLMLLIAVKIEKLLSKLRFLDDWILRIFLGVAFFLHGYQKLPLPSQNMIEWFGFSPWLATIIPLAEVLGGSLIIISGFIKAHWGSLGTRLAGLIIFVYMTFAFAIAHQNWFITPKLFMSEQIFLWALGLYFLLKGKPSKE